ncbi:MAG: YqjK family protein [Tepidimonas sp.]|uniref:YqjK family protein n=1 Tax=Tepidimonas sp. TaxID=2002775 RepID=UPI00259ECAF3|nr:YqjK family protein [Tepidimonas sp.]MDM7456672.1 YqjK family protein [Tepidimonas sp.]
MAAADAHDRLAARRHALQQRSAELRERLAMHSAALAPAIGWADRAREGWRWLRTHPWVPLAGAVVLVLRRPRMVWRGGWWVWRAWRLWQRYSPWLSRVGVRPGRPFPSAKRRADRI